MQFEEEAVNSGECCGGFVDACMAGRWYVLTRGRALGDDEEWCHLWGTPTPG